MVPLKRLSRSWPVSAVALLAQVLALLVGLVLVFPLAEFFGFSFLPLFYAALIIGVMAAVLGYAWGLSSWWLAINLLFVPGLFLAYSMSIEPRWFLVLFALLLVVYWGVFHSRVPLYLTGAKALQALNRLLPVGKPFRFVDLGAGTGRVLSYLASTRPEGVYTGMESAPLPFLVGRYMAARAGDSWSLRWGSLWGADLAAFDVIYAYLSPAPMPRLLLKLKAEMKPEAVFISNTFALPGIAPSETVELSDLHGSILYLYRHDDIIMAKGAPST
jgi:SAM-dependent methyltransferase